MVVEGVAKGPKELMLQKTASVMGVASLPVASLSDSKPFEPDPDRPHQDP